MDSQVLDQGQLGYESDVLRKWTVSPNWLRMCASWPLCSLCSHRLELPPQNKGARLKLQLCWCSGRM